MKPDFIYYLNSSCPLKSFLYINKNHSPKLEEEKKSYPEKYLISPHQTLKINFQLQTQKAKIILVEKMFLNYTPK